MTRFIPYSVYNGQKNMDIDSELLEEAISNQLDYPIFRLYGWEPACISLGRNQDESFIDKEFLSENNIELVRRLTGGRALLHDKEITYSYICPVSYLKHGEHIISSYKEICEILIKKFHGSILYDYNKPLLEKIFNESVSTDEIISIKEINSKLTLEEIIAILSEE